MYSLDLKITYCLYDNQTEHVSFIEQLYFDKPMLKSEIIKHVEDAYKHSSNMIITGVTVINE